MSKFGSTLNVVNISWAMSMRSCLYSKFCNFGTIFTAAGFIPRTHIKIAWHKPNDISTSSATSLIVIPWLSKIIFCFSWLAKRLNQHFKCPCIFNLIFYTKLNTVSLIHFFRIVKNRKVHHNTTNLYICQKQTWQSKIVDVVNIYNMCTDITGKDARIEHM